MKHIGRLTTPLLLTLVLSGCANQKADRNRKVSIPETLCGVSVDPTLVAPLLPSGKKLELESRTPVDGYWRCYLAVDGVRALTVSREWWDRTAGVDMVANVHADVDADQYTPDERFVYSGRGAVGRVGCKERVASSSRLFTVVQSADSVEPDAIAMLRLITAYTEAVADSEMCASTEAAERAM